MSKRYLATMVGQGYIYETDDHEEATIKAKQSDGTVYVRQDHFRPTIEGHVATLKSFLAWYREHMVDHVGDTVDFVVFEYLTHIGFKNSCLI